MGVQRVGAFLQQNGASDHGWEVYCRGGARPVGRMGGFLQERWRKGWEVYCRRHGLRFSSKFWGGHEPIRSRPQAPTLIVVTDQERGVAAGLVLHLGGFVQVDSSCFTGRFFAGRAKGPRGRIHTGQQIWRKNVDRQRPAGGYAQIRPCSWEDYDRTWEVGYSVRSPKFRRNTAFGRLSTIER